MTKRVTTTIAMSVSLLAPMLLTMNVLPVNVSLATTTPSSTQNHTNNYLTGQSLGEQDGKVGVYDPPGSCGEVHGTNADHCHAGYNMGYVTACTLKTAKFGCGDGPTTQPDMKMLQ